MDMDELFIALPTQPAAIQAEFPPWQGNLESARRRCCQSWTRPILRECSEARRAIQILENTVRDSHG